MVTDHLMDRMGLNPIQFVHVNLTATVKETETETVCVNVPFNRQAANKRLLQDFYTRFLIEKNYFYWFKTRNFQEKKTNTNFKTKIKWKKWNYF